MPHARGGAKNMPAFTAGIFFCAHFFSGGVIRAAENAQCRTGDASPAAPPRALPLENPPYHAILYKEETLNKG